MSQMKRELGKFMTPITGRRCQARAGCPRSTMRKSEHMTTAVIATISPKSTISRMGLNWYRYAGMTSSTAAAAMPTRKVKLAM